MPVYPPVEVPIAAAATDHAAIYVIFHEAVGQNKVHVYVPSFAQQTISVVPSSAIARDSANVIVQTISQTYFQDNIINFLPSEWRKWDAIVREEGGGDGALNDFLQVFAISLDEIKQAIDDFTKVFDIEHCPPRYLKVIADLLNYPLEDGDSTAEQRRQLHTAIEWYKTKGSRKAFTSFLYAFGFYADVVPLWTEDYAEFTEGIPAPTGLTSFSDSIPGVAAGNDPPNDYPLLVENGGTWYRSPHFGVRLRMIIGDRHLTIEWADTPQEAKDRYYARAEQIGAHWAFYEMVDELSTYGALLHYYFPQDSFEYLHRRIEFIRPVFAVLQWLETLVEMQEEYLIDDEAFLPTANPTKEEPGWYAGYCDMDDITYTRLDERLLGSDMRTLPSPLVAGAPSVVDIVDEATASISSVVFHVEGTLAHSWLYPDVTFEVTVGGSPVELTDNGEGILGSADGTIEGFLDYLTGDWQILFTVSPDNPSNVLASYSYTTGIPPTDRSGVMPRGSTELPYPHLRDPQPGICHPIEELEVEIYYVTPDYYHLPLTRDGLNLYPTAGPVPFIDHADFPSRGFTDVGGPGHANTFTRELGYSDRPLSLLKVEVNPPPAGVDWEDQSTDWELITTDWEEL